MVVHHEAMTRDWKALGRAIEARREALGMPRQQDLAEEAGVSRQTVQSLESGKEYKRTPKTLDQVLKTLGRDRGWAAKILDGESPTSQNGATARLAEGMPVRVVQELSSGEVVDTEVVEFSVPGTPLTFVGILKQDAPARDLSPEDMARALEKWTRIQRALREIADDQTGSSDPQ